MPLEMTMELNPDMITPDLPQPPPQMHMSQRAQRAAAQHHYGKYNKHYG
jgi:hypothetical protein